MPEVINDVSIMPEVINDVAIMPEVINEPIKIGSSHIWGEPLVPLGENLSVLYERAPITSITLLY